MVWLDGRRDPWNRGARAPFENTPRWSPGGRRVVLGSAADLQSSGQPEDQTQDLWVRDADGSKPRKLVELGANGNATYVFPWSWSPDGARIAFTATRWLPDGTFSHEGLTVVELRTRVTTRLPGCDGSPTRRPDGRTIACQGPRRGIVTIRPDGTNARRLTRGADRAPLYSPDGRWIAFLRERGTTYLHVMRADGSGIRRVSRVRADESRYDWSPDSRRLVWSDGCNLLVAPAHGRGPAVRIGPGRDPDWSPRT